MVHKGMNGDNEMSLNPPFSAWGSPSNLRIRRERNRAPSINSGSPVGGK